MWLYQLACVFILATATANADSYYESHSTTWKDVTCNLAEPQLKYHNGFFEVNETLTITNDVWLGYIYAKVPFLLLGCASLQSKNGEKVNEIGYCFTICEGGNFGIKRTSHEQSGLVCICVMGSLDTTGASCKGGDQNNLCNNCSEIYTQKNVNASVEPEGDCLTYYYPHFKWQPCTRKDGIRTMCSNATHTDLTATATIADYVTRSEWSTGNKLCLTNGRHPSFERGITNAGFGDAAAQYFWTGVFRANILIKLSLKRSSVLHWVANIDDMRKALCGTGTESTTTRLKTTKYTSDVTPYGTTTVALATDNAFPTSNGGTIEESRHTNTEKSPALGLGIGVSVGILFLVGGAVVIVVLKRRRVLPCWKIKTAEDQSRQRFEERQETNYEGMIDRNVSNHSYCVLGSNIDSDVGNVSYINPQRKLNSKEDKCSSEYYNMGSYENVPKAHTERDLNNK